MIKPLEMDLCVIPLVSEHIDKVAVGTYERKWREWREGERIPSPIHLRPVKHAPRQRWHLIPSAPDRVKAIKETNLPVLNMGWR